MLEDWKEESKMDALQVNAKRLREIKELEGIIKELEQQVTERDEDIEKLNADISRWKHGSCKSLVNIHKKAKERFMVNLDTLYPNLYGNISQLVWDAIESYTAMSREDWTR